MCKVQSVFVSFAACSALVVATVVVTKAMAQQNSGQNDAKQGEENLAGEKSTAEPAKTTYNFDDDLVTGDLVRPDGELLRVRRRGGQSSLIRIREHFIPELVESVEEL